MCNYCCTEGDQQSHMSRLVLDRGFWQAAPLLLVARTYGTDLSPTIRQSRYIVIKIGLLAQSCQGIILEPSESVQGADKDLPL